MLNSTHKILSHTAKILPDKPAFITPSSTTISYSKLDELSTALASEILNHKIYKSPILIILPKSIEAIISFFGVLKSGNFYTIIDENMPTQRVEKIVKKLSPALLITSKDLKINLNLKTIFIDDVSKFKIENNIYR